MLFLGANDNASNDYSLVSLMADPRCQDPKVKVCIRLIDRLCRENHLVIHMNFPDDHPVEEVGRVLLALLIKYQGIESLIEQLVDQEIENPGSGPLVNNSSSKAILDALKAVHQVKWKLVRIRQEQSKSYKEVCSSVLERCKFLFNDIRPYHTKRPLKILTTQPKLKTIVKRIIRNRRCSSTSPSFPALLRPEDIFNVSIQSQEALGNSGADDPPLEPPSHVELNKDALLDRIQQQQLREQEVVTRTDSVSEANEEDTETKSDEEDVDDEAKDEDSKRHDTKIGWFAEFFFLPKIS